MAGEGSRAMEKTKILIVDDEQDVVQALQFRLETAGYETFTALDGAQALNVLAERKVDLILADFMMPEVNGLELTRRVKENPAWATIKVVLFSCNAEPEFQKRAIELGAVDYLPKMTGAGSIVIRVYELLAPEQKQPGEPGAPIPEETPEQRTLAQQMRTISEGIVDFIHLVRMSDELTPSADYALQSAESLAEDLHRLASSVDANMLPMMKAGNRSQAAKPDLR
jgi:CheY-like chemotaxis protein